MPGAHKIGAADFGPQKLLRANCGHEVFFFLKFTVPYPSLVFFCFLGVSLAVDFLGFLVCPFGPLH